jgi:acid phosphatase
VRATTDGRRIDHYTVLRTIEDMYGLSPLGHAASDQPLTGIWTG